MGVRTILPGQGDTLNVMSPLIPFNMVVDTDLGLLCIVMKKYLDGSVFNLDFFKGQTVKSLVTKLYFREEKNPLLLCLRDEYRDKADLFFDQFMEREYKEILGKSCITEVYRLVEVYNAQSEIKVTIVCDNELEIELLKKHPSLTKANIVMYDEAKKYLKSHHQFYFKYLEDIKRYTKFLKNRTLYFANYKFNKLEEELKNPLVTALINDNRVMAMDIYNLEKLGIKPIDEEE
ncbi:MAG: hypothetical protein NC548_34830 [Lachnospiraceae bacterium]|nr:hypothetical protein [Lachnospiraceae bacterium]